MAAVSLDTAHWPHSEIAYLRQEVLRLYEERRKVDAAVAVQYARIAELERKIVEARRCELNLLDELARPRPDELHGCTAWRK